MSHHIAKKQKNKSVDNSTNKRNVENTLKMLGVESKYIHRALKVYEKHYGIKYNIEVIIEIIYRLKVKDKLKHQKHEQNIFESEEHVEKVLLSMDFSPYYVKRGIAEYQQNKGINYNIEIITEIIMNLRAKDKRKENDDGKRKYYVGKMISSNDNNNKLHKTTASGITDEFVMYQKMLSMGFENAIAFDASHYNPRDIKETINFAKIHKESMDSMDDYDDIKVKEEEMDNIYNEYNDNNNKYKEYKLPQFVSENDTESLLVDSCDFSVFDCNSFKRINFILYKYNEWIINDDIDKKIGFYEMILNINYSNNWLLDDYHHLIYYHDFDQIYKHLQIKCFDDNPHHLTGCKSLIRNHRNRLEEVSKCKYFNNNRNEINIEQIMDMIHCYFLHSYHLGLILTPNEFIYIHNNNNENKSNSDDDDDNDDNMNGDTVKIQNIQKIVNRKRKRIEYLRGTDRFLKHNKFVTKINDYINCGNILISSQIGIKYEYYDDNDCFYVNPMYLSFGEEILNLISMNEWNILKLRATNMKNKKYSALLMADNIDNGCRIEGGSLMYIEHLLSIMIYCNFDIIQTEFIETCLNIDNIDNIDNADKLLLHRKFANLGKRLYESVWVFGSTTNSSDIFYHSLCKIGNDNGSICFSSIINCISLPLSTSSKIEVLLNYSGCLKQGIILQLKQNGVYSTMKYFDCEWISDFGGEAELFFFNNNMILAHLFNINSIISIQTDLDNEYGADYRDYLICLEIIDKIFNAGYYFGINQLENKILDKTVDLLNYHHQNIPKYISNLIHLYCKNLLLIKINWPDILHYYSFITSLLCYKQNVFINLRVIMKIFKNCKKIIIHGGNPSVLSLNHNKIDYIYSFLYQNQQNKQINLKNIQITSISKESILSFKSTIKQYKQRFNNINCKIYIQNQKVYGAQKSLIIQC